MRNIGNRNRWALLGAGTLLTHACAISNPPVDIGGTGGAAPGDGSGGAATGGAPGSGGLSSGGLPGSGGLGSGGLGSGGGSSTGGADAGSSGGAVSTGGSDAGTDGGHDAGPKEPGCRTNADCASGQCNEHHECAPCLLDSECAIGHVCSSGQCLPACEDSVGCPSQWSCCDSRCADTVVDRKSCGGCGTMCGDKYYCGATGCTANTLNNLCEHSHVTVLLDGLDVDDAISNAFDATLSAGCSSTPTVVVESQDTTATLNQATGRPNGNSGELYVQIGGPYGQRLTRYLEASGESLVYSVYAGDRAGFYARGANGAGTVIIDAPRENPDAGPDALTAGHDLFVVEMLLDRGFGSRTLAVYGLFSPGTVAGTWLLTHEIFPNLSTYTNSYYVYEWTDEDGDLAPGAADTFTLVKAGK